MREKSSNLSKEYSQLPKQSRGGEKKVMKKSLLLMLSFAMVFTLFASVAFAAEESAELTVEQKFEALKNANILQGTTDADGNTIPGLDQPMTRAQAAEVLVNLFALPKVATASSFSDVSDNHWAMQQIEAVKDATFMVGNTDGTFAPEKNLSLEELASVICEVLGLAPQDDAVLEGATWGAGYVATALGAGLLTASNDYTADAIRTDLVNVTYAAYQQIVASQQATAVVAVTGAKTIGVTFSKAVDATKAAITVKNSNNVKVNAQKTEWADDNASVKLTFANNLPAGDYTVTITNVNADAITQTVTVTASKVTSIEFTSDLAQLNRADHSIVTIGYKVTNQYGEDISGVSLTATATKGTATASNGVLTVDAGTDFIVDEKLAVTLLESSSTVFASVTATVSAPSQVSSVAITGVHQADGKTLEAGSTDTFYLVLDLKDQYGNNFTDATSAKADLAVTVSNPSVASLDGYVAATNKANFTYPVTIDGKKKLVIALAPDAAFTGGSSTVTLISIVNGSKASYTIDVKDQSKVDVLTLSTPTLAPIGEDVSIPFSAVDQFGEEVLNPTLPLNVTSAAGVANNVKFVKDPFTGTSELVLHLDAAGSPGNVIITAITDTNKFVSLTVPTVAAKTATVITGVKDIPALLKDATKNVTASNVIVQDQYSRDMDLPVGYKINVAISGSAITSADTELPADLKANEKGSSAITLTLVDASGKTLNASSYTFNLRVVDKGEIESYEATIGGTIYDNGGVAYAKKLTVNGILADGSKVAVPNTPDNVKVVIPTASGYLTYDSVTSNVYSDGTGTTKDDIDAVVIVTVLGATEQIIPVTITVSEAAPEIASLVVKGDKGDTTLRDENYISISGITAAYTISDLEDDLIDAVKATDQYGVEVVAPEEEYPTIIVTNLGSKTLAGYNGAATTTLSAGNTIDVIAFTPDGKSVSLKVFVD